MAPFTFTSPDPPDAVLGRLRAEGRRRSGAMHPAVRATRGDLVVRVAGTRFRAWVAGGRAVGPVAEGEVAPAEGGARLEGRLRYSWPDRIFTPIWVAWLLFLGFASGDWAFALPVAALWAAFGALWLFRVVWPREDALRAVLAAVARAEPAPEPPWPGAGAGAA